MSQSANLLVLPLKSSMFSYISIRNHVRVESSGVTPGQAKFANDTSPGLTWKANAPQYGGGRGGGVGKRRRGS